MTALNQEVVRYTSEQVCDLAGVSYRQLDYWVRLRLVKPDHARAGSGNRRRWTTREAYKAVAMARMLADGITFTKASELIQRGCYVTLAKRPLPEIPESEQPKGGEAGG